MTPPAFGKSPFMTIPAEMRRQIFAYSFPDQGQVFQPWCSAADTKRPDPSRKINKHAHTVPNLMTLNRRACEELTEVMYRERTFVIHVHGGLRTGGVELLNAGRQPLQYLDSKEDKRFAKFEDGKAFGLSNMKKIIIEIFPTTEDQDRHVALNTHFMILALCRLLERPNKGNKRITSISVKFAAGTTPAPQRASRQAIMRREQPWKDSDGPRQSSIHCISDIELVLRPFAMLTGCHNVSIELPSYLASHQDLAAFVNGLRESMQSVDSTLVANELLEYHVENLRSELEEHVFALQHDQGKRCHVEKLTDKELGLSSDEDDINSDCDMLHDEEVSSGKELGLKHQTPDTLSPIISYSESAKRRKILDRSEKQVVFWSSILDDLETVELDEDAQLTKVLQLSVGGGEGDTVLRRSARDKATQATQSTVGDVTKHTKEDLEFEVTVRMSRDEITFEKGQTILQAEDHTEDDASKPAQPLYKGLAPGGEFVGGMFNVPSTAMDQNDNLAICTMTTGTAASNDDDAMHIDTDDEADPACPAPEIQLSGLVRATTAFSRSGSTSTAGSYVLFGPHGPMQTQATPRAVMQAEDSGIGMPMSEDGVKQHDETRAGKGIGERMAFTMAREE